MMMKMPRSKKRVKYFCRMALLWSEREGWRNMLGKKYSSTENIRDAVVVRRGARRRRARGVGKKDEIMSIEAGV